MCRLSQNERISFVLITPECVDCHKMEDSVLFIITPECVDCHKMEDTILVLITSECIDLTHNGRFNFSLKPCLKTDTEI